MNLIGSQARPADLSDLLLREEDAGEVSAGWREAVMTQIIAGRTVAYRDTTGALAGLFGIQMVGGVKAVTVWLLCSPVADKYPRSVWRISKEWMVNLQKLADAGFVVGNDIPKQSVRNRAFIKRLGFVIDEKTDFFYLPKSHHV